MAAKSVEYWLDRLKGQLRREQLAALSIDPYLRVARHFLLHLQKCNREVQSVGPSDLQMYLRRQRYRYQRRYGRLPGCLKNWRSQYTGSLHRLLRLAQGQWPPTSPDDSMLEEFATDLAARGIHLPVARRYRLHARFFLEYLRNRSLQVRYVKPNDVAGYFRVALRIYQRKKPGLPRRRACWRHTRRQAVYSLLRFVQSEWPPSVCPASCERFRDYLEEAGYNQQAIRLRVRVARQFVVYLDKRCTPLRAAGSGEIADFVRTRLVRYRRRHGRLPGNLEGWRSSYTAALRGFLRLINPCWCLPRPPTDAAGQFRVEIIEGYKRWLVDVRGLSEATLRKNGGEAERFLSRLGADRLDPGAFVHLGVADIDAYLSWRLPILRRATRYGVCDCLRSLLNYLYSASLISRDLAGEVKGPVLFHNDEIPRAFTEEQVASLLAITRCDRSAKGLRDYSMLLMLATYGLRAGEIVHLRLDDIDWRADRIRIQHSKTGVEAFVPLVAPVGEALLKYLQEARPQTPRREVFLRMRAPICPFQTVSALHGVIATRMKQAGIAPRGRHGTHAFRFARAHSLLQASVSLKSISDLLGHLRTASTESYLRLATDNLRSVSLDIPGGPISAGSGP